VILPNMIESAKSAGLSDIVLLHEHRGRPTALTVSHLPHGPTVGFSLHNVVLRADIPRAAKGTVSESYPHLIFEGFTTKLGQRVVQVLKVRSPAFPITPTTQAQYNHDQDTNPLCSICFPHEKLPPKSATEW
jgi:rRNA maturation protein Rpf1